MSEPAARPPNVLFIMADQMAAPALPVYGHRIVQAPHLQRLAARSVVFDAAYCNSPICAPSRFSMLTGRLPSAIDAFDNASELPASTPTLAHYLTLLGYRTILCGKMHFVGPDQHHGYAERLVTDIYPADFEWVPDWREGPANAPTGISVRPVLEAGTCVRSLQIDYDDEVEHHALQKLHDLARFEGDRPFFLTVSFSHPHSPYTATEAHWNRYRHADIDLPAVPPLPLDALDTHSRWLYYSHGRDRFTVTEDHVRNARHAYYGMISYVDDKVGRLLRTLEETRLAENTVVVFAADHGEMLGERGMWFKQTFFEWSARVPFMVAWPGRLAPRRESKVVSLLDLAPTLLDIAGAGAAPAPVDAFDGRSLVPLMHGTGAGWPDRAISEYSDMGVCAPCRMVRQGRYKHMYTHGHDSLLFDLAADPHERTNLVGRPEVREVQAQLRAAILHDWDPDAVARRIAASQARRMLIRDAARKCEGYPNWSFQATRDDAHRFVRGSGAGGGAMASKARARFPFVAPATPDEAPGGGRP
jgi:choline-sulfatase